MTIGPKLALALLLGSLLGCGTARQVEATGPLAVRAERVFPGVSFSLPVAMLQAPGDPGRFFVVEKRGRVRAFDNDPQVREASTWFADPHARVDSGPNEAGLLGMAFHPDFQRNATVFLSYTADGSPLTSFVSRFRAGAAGIDADSEIPVLSVAQPYGNHNGGNIVFGPDGLLYIGLGDGGAGGDPHGHGQNTRTLLGALLRIDVDRGTPYAIPPDNPFAASTGCDAGGGCPELYAWGLRNPWRWSFDRDTGELWLADVGQGDWEEVDRVVRGGNYGWAVREGAHCYRPVRGCPSAGLIDPVAEYDHSLGYSITGGYVYRGSRMPALRGFYVYGDFGSGRVWALDTGQSSPLPVLLLESGLHISSFAEDAAGELYLLDYSSGGLFQLAPGP